MKNIGNDPALFFNWNHFSSINYNLDSREVSHSDCSGFWKTTFFKSGCGFIVQMLITSLYLRKFS